MTQKHVIPTLCKRILPFLMMTHHYLFRLVLGRYVVQISAGASTVLTRVCILGKGEYQGCNLKWTMPTCVSFAVHCTYHPLYLFEHKPLQLQW
jgi:hypothetical protein